MKKLKILHIGNIANNAYLNAKLLREKGHECHVACNDYYHFAGCSEWIDLTIPIDRQAIGNPDFPNFWKLGANKPQTPRWFAQGPQASVLNYLYFLNKDNEELTRVAWDVLQYQKFKVLYRRDTMAFQEIWSSQDLDVALQDMGIDSAFVSDVLGGLPSDEARRLVYDWNCKISGNLTEVSMPSFPAERSLLESYAVFEQPLRELLEAHPSGQYLESICLTRRDVEGSPASMARLAAHPGSEVYIQYLEQWREILPFYDLVMAYGPFPIIPYLAATPNYVAYEHGTLRDLPFTETVEAELITASYEHAQAVFVTNTDYLDQKRQLNIAPNRLHCLPHAFDERPLRAYVASHPIAQPEMITFFAPARQDWIKQFPSMTKNNHFVVHAARTLREQGYAKFQVVFVEWGDDVQATKALIAEHGLSDMFVWTSPLAKQQLWTAYASAHAVIDQFLLPSISGVSFEALALGRRVITCDNGISNRKAFGQQPPLLTANDVESLILAMRTVLDDPQDQAGIGRASWEWIDKFHSASRIVELQEAVFASL